MNGMARRQAVTMAAGMVATGSVATRLARLERALLPARDGDPIVVVFEGLDGSHETRGTIGADSLVIRLGYRADGPQ